MRSLWDWFIQLDATLAAALVAAIVSILGTILTISSPIGTYLLAKRQLRDRLKTEYEYEQRKKLRDLIGRYHGSVLQAVEEFNYRMMGLYASEDQNWLCVGDDYRAVGAHPDNYYVQTTVHRFVALFAIIRQFEAEALCADARIADIKDFEFLKYTRAMLWTATGTQLFLGLDYDGTDSTDHFFRDDLRRACDHSWIKDGGEGRIITLDELRDLMGEAAWLTSTLDFFKGLRANEDRYRWDRLVTLHLILLAFIEDFGHDFQRPDKVTIEHVTRHFRNPQVPCNLLDWLPKLGLLQETSVGPYRLSNRPQEDHHSKNDGIQMVADTLKSSCK